MGSRLRILVVDDIEANRSLITRFVSTLGHETVCATNGREAVDACRERLPDVVLMDVMMPVMDGYAAATEIRALCGTRWLPIIFLSAKSSETEQLEGLDIGDDYLTKPVSLAMLRAKIGVMRRIADMQAHLADNAASLAAYHDNNEQEQQFTRHILDHIVGYSDCLTGPLKRWIKPARHLSGDVVAQACSPTGTLHALIADSTGHGLAAAISVVPAIDTFYTMTRRGYDIGSIVREINSKLHGLLPANRFVAAAAVSIDRYRQQIEVWNGGIPTVMFVNADRNVAYEWPSRHPPLGILSDAEFDPSLERWQWSEQGEMLLCSDGLIEAENAACEPFGRARLLDAIARDSGDDSFAAVVDAITAHLGGRDNHDDLSLAAIACTGALHQPCNDSHPSIETPQFNASNWSLHLHFGVAEIREQAVQPLLTRWLNQLSLGATEFGELLLILNELCTNAVDHGLLRLDSALKQHPEGYELFHRERLQRLAQLPQGAIDVQFSQFIEGGKRLLQIRITDSGKGFEHARHTARGGQTSELPHGRGIALVSRLATSLRYAGCGNEAIVDYALQD
ncbi:MAG TPA: SpoIIE family protein phosphatase [Aromatoleum sp.]|uniref:SpoIIE family protein phosphatase n=1 Tax=Aromatoleum sp. TaxID=2307007 RepID=UPI002B47C004|nr:SpoIIE family protein phosphatase [Aromatoleum sp.]HJV28106.1 SpoIIE family protein phosphatase [Aromatoleum sp.]